MQSNLSRLHAARRNSCSFALLLVTILSSAACGTRGDAGEGKSGSTVATAGGDVVLEGPAPTGLSTVEVFGRAIPGVRGTMPALVYRPPDELKPTPVVIYLHVADTTAPRADVERTARQLARDAKVSVVTLGVPIGSDSATVARAARMAYRWARSNASSIAANPYRVSLLADTTAVARAAIAAVQQEPYEANGILVASQPAQALAEALEEQLGEDKRPETAGR